MTAGNSGRDPPQRKRAAPGSPVPTHCQGRAPVPGRRRDKRQRMWGGCRFHPGHTRPPPCRPGEGVDPLDQQGRFAVTGWGADQRQVCFRFQRQFLQETATLHGPRPRSRRAKSGQNQRDRVRFHRIVLLYCLRPREYISNLTFDRCDPSQRAIRWGHQLYEAYSGMKFNHEKQ